MHRISAGGLRWLGGGAALLVLASAFVLTLGGLGWWSRFEAGRVRPLDDGDQEIAWIAPATSGETWERLVKAVRLLARQCKQAHATSHDLTVNEERAFLLLTADVPEVGLKFPESGTLWIRWYKLSGNTDTAHWINALERRGRPPLAIAGGETTDRALAIAEILAKHRDSWSGPAPLFLITTATAERYLPPGQPELKFSQEQWPRLMEVYAGRSFRFCFTNTRMVEAVLEFVHQHPDVWPRYVPEKAAAQQPPFFLFTFTWLDDGYSKDLAFTYQRLFGRRVSERFGEGTLSHADEDFIAYSVGDYYHPNPREELAVSLFLSNLDRRKERPHLLVVPTGTHRARRFLRTLASRAPKDIRNMVVANGDAISFNNVYRDRDRAWNIQDVPMPLVFFTHRNPIDAEAGFGVRENDRVEQSSTQDLLLFRDLFEAMVLASFADGRLQMDADAVVARLRATVWQGQRVGRGPEGNVPFFDAEGNRTAETGEHVVWLSPTYEGARVLPQADLSVWSVAGADRWQRVGAPLRIYYDRSAEQGERP